MGVSANVTVAYCATAAGTENVAAAAAVDGIELVLKNGYLDAAPVMSVLAPAFQKSYTVGSLAAILYSPKVPRTVLEDYTI